MANQYTMFTPQQYGRESQYVPLPFDRIAAAAEGQQKQYDDKLAQVSLLGKDWQVHPEDEKLHNQVKQEIDAKLQNLANTDLLSPEGKNKFNQVRNDVIKEYGQFGRIGKMQTSLANYQNHIKDLEDGAKEFIKTQGKSGISPEQKNLGLAEAAQDYKGGVAANKVYSGREMNPFYNINEKAMTLAEHAPIKKWASESGWGQDSQGNWRENNGKGEIITQNQIIKKILPELVNDPLANKYLDDVEGIKGKLEGENPEGHIGYDHNGNQVQYSPNDKNTAIESRKYKQLHDAAVKAGNYWERNNILDQNANMKFDPGYEAAAKKKIENQHIALTSNIERAGMGSSLSSPKDVENKLNTVDTQNQQVVNNAKDFRDAKGNKLLFDSQVNMLDMMTKGKANFDITNFHANDEQRDVLLKYLNNVNQNNLIKQQTKEFDNRAKTEAGIDKNYQPKQEVIDDAEKLAVNSYGSFAGFGDEAKAQLYKEGNKNPTINQLYNKVLENVSTRIPKPGDFSNETVLNDINQEYKGAKEAYDQSIANNDPRYKKYHEILKKNSENSTETLGVTSFTNKGAEDQLASILERDVTEQGGLGAKDLKTGKDLLPDQYKEVGKIDPQSIGYHFEGDQLHLVIRANKPGKDAGKTDYIDVKAPEGTEQFVLQSKNVTAKQIVANNLLKQAENSPNFTQQILIEDQPLTIRKLTNTDISKAPKGEQYEIRLGDTVNYYTKDGAIKALTNLDQ